MRVTIGLSTAVFLAWAALGVADGVSDSEQTAFEKQIRNLEEPLRAELQDKGLAEIDAQSAAKQAVDELIRCSISSVEYPDLESKMIIIRIGGKTIVTPETPCIYEFLELAGVSKN